ncbi:MAG: hypothetical protein Q4Q03_05815, partial [Bowdeniella nasicola]|nr:hypothetical protein [Bowdeniella nasicola]
MSRPRWLRPSERGLQPQATVANDGYDVLFVCTGNICRSAYADLRLAQRRPDLRVGSAGIGALSGHDIDRPMRDYLPADISWPPHEARQATTPILQSSSLILAMEDVHVAWIIETVPAVATRTFTLRQLARLLQEQPPDAPTSAGELARRYAKAAGEVQSEDGIADPYRRSQSRYARSVHQID